MGTAWLRPKGGRHEDAAGGDVMVKVNEMKPPVLPDAQNDVDAMNDEEPKDLSALAFNPLKGGNARKIPNWTFCASP